MYVETRISNEPGLTRTHVSFAGYTPQDNRADFGSIFPFPTILYNVPIILVDLKII